MPELRRDMVTGNWVIVATERAMRPTDLFISGSAEMVKPEDCPFCPGNESLTPREVYAVRFKDSEPDGPGWRVRVVPNKFPAFNHGEKVADNKGLFQRCPSEGVHEVIIHSPDHATPIAAMSMSEVELIMEVYRDRYRANAGNPEVDYVHIILNHGAEAGASLEHPHTQLFGVPVVPPLVRQELDGARKYQEQESGCLFCDMIDQELAAGERVVSATDDFVVITPFASRFPFELWVLPRVHEPSFGDIEDGLIPGFASTVRDILRKLDQGFTNPPVNYYLHTAPCDAGGYGYYHWHLECMPRITTPGAFEWGTGMMINIVTPEHAAKFLTSD